ncbi:MAG: hypothetical protein EBU46_08950 [Nitrosomonadaceae bacterium]|nr:hypothetical protein [Nitrosomonadaceae bacterium]
MQNNAFKRGFLKAAVRRGINEQRAVDFFHKQASLQHLDLTASLKNFHPTKPNIRPPGAIKKPAPVKKPADTKYPTVNRDINISEPAPVKHPTIKSPKLKDPPELNVPGPIKPPKLPPQKSIKVPAIPPAKPIDHSNSALLNRSEGSQLS